MLDTLEKLVPLSILRLITTHASLRQIISNAAWLFADSGSTLIAGFLVGAWVARYLGPTQYGTFNYALAIVALFTPLLGLGIKDIVTRDLVREPGAQGEILGTAFGLQMLGGLLSLGFAVGIAEFTRSDDPVGQALIVILALQFVFQVFSVTLGYWFNSQVQAKYAVWSNSLALLFYSLVRVVLVLVRAPLVAFAWAALGQALLYAVAVAVFYRHTGERLRAWTPSLARAGRLLLNSWPLLVSGLAIMVYMKIGQVMLANMVGSSELGIYAAALRLSEFWYFVPVAIAASVFPALVRSQQHADSERHRRRMQLFYDAMMGTAYAIVLPMVLLAPLLVKIVFGAAYAEATPMLRVHVCSLLFVFLGTARGRWLIAEDLVRFNMIFAIVGAITNILMNVLLIPSLGGLGAAYAVLISQAVSTYLSNISTTRLRAVFWQQTLALAVPFRLLSVKAALGELSEQSPA